MNWIIFSIIVVVLIFIGAIYCSVHSYYNYVQVNKAYNTYIASVEFKKIEDDIKTYELHLLELEQKKNISATRNQLLQLLDIVNQMQHKEQRVYLQTIKFSEKGFSIVGIANDSDVWKQFSQKIETHIKGIEVSGKHEKNGTMDGVLFRMDGSTREEQKEERYHSND